jgi:hypothetical protein
MRLRLLHEEVFPMSYPAPLAKYEDAPRWALLLTVLALIAAVVGGFRWLNARTGLDHVVGQPATLGEQGPLASIDPILDERTPANLIGRSVALEGAALQEVAGDYTFWVGPSAQRRVPVLLWGELTARQPEKEARLRPGRRVRVFGIVRDMREFTAFGTDPLLSAEQLSEIEQHAVFISARRVLPLPE